MKTIAARFSDESFAQLELVASLTGVPIVAVIRDAVEAHIERKMADGELTARAHAALDDIDREAEAKREAIGLLISNLPKGTAAPAKGRSRRGQTASPEAQMVESRPIGYLPAQARRREGVAAP